ncbi:P-loop containing nucleoside triphosphate hydrolase [Sesbania bispinosa]|nr:P-loop containing nucleoside triphosphate hydrolase [Sesbania bispinosa]
MGGHQREKDEIIVTWENSEATVTNGKNRKVILHGLTGYAQTGKLLAIMGPSGCGKSTLLDALAVSRFYDHNREERTNRHHAQRNGLQDAINTRVGGWGSKGLSGDKGGDSAFALRF